MQRTVLVTALVLALAACGQPGDRPEEPAPATPAATVAEPAPVDPATTDGSTQSVGSLDAAIAGDWRSPEHRARDAFRHPKETLEFFGIRPDMHVLEITPGGAAWYSEILAPYLRDQGRWVGAVVAADKEQNEGAREYYTRGNDELRTKFAGNPALYDKTELVEFDQAAPAFGAPGTFDAVLTFRNVHNWMNNEGKAERMFGAFFEALKPGGVLGVVEHRAAQDVPAGDKSGYVSEAQVIALAEKAGFVLEEKSEVNANPADTRDHPNGVWTLPPSNRHDEADREKYQTIGESDRMTLRFRKPAA